MKALCNQTYLVPDNSAIRVLFDTKHPLTLQISALNSSDMVTRQMGSLIEGKTHADWTKVGMWCLGGAIT